MESSESSIPCIETSSSSSTCVEEHTNIDVAAASPLSITIYNATLQNHPYRRAKMTNYSLNCRQSSMIKIVCAATTLIHCICISEAMLMPSQQMKYNSITRAASTSTNNINSIERYSRRVGGENNYEFLGGMTATSLLSSSTQSTTTLSWRKRQRRKIVDPLKHLVGKIRSKSPLRKRYDDTLTSSRGGNSFGSRAANNNYNKITNNHNNRRNISPSSLHNRIHRVQSIATSSSSSTSLQMVLSTPDTIIEQASTQKLLDTLIDESVRTSARHPVMMQFNPKRDWIWRQWRGTVFSETWKSGLMNMVLATFVVMLYGVYPNLKDMLQGFSILWGQLLSVTTFTLTFFLNQSYGLWRKCYDYSRRLQGRLNDLGLTLAAHATRSTPSSPDMPSTYTPQSRQALELVSRYVRVFNLLTYASFTRSHRPILTPRGMRRLVERGILTPKEREILSDAEVPATQRHNAVLIWLIRLFLEGRQSGIFEGGMGFEQQFMEKCHVIRAQYGAIGDELQGRMPLAYAHIVQILLDVVLWMYPFMALSTGMAWYISILGSGLLTMFYQGLFDLAKQFLDPYDNENYGKGDDPLVIDTLIAETNAGSVRWLNSFAQQPWSRQRLKDGELYDSILPQRGYTTEELMEKEEQEERERQERETARREKKLRDEERERERLEQMLMEHHPNIVNGTNMVIGEKRNGTAILTPRGEDLMDSVAEEGSVFDQEKRLIEISGGQIVSESFLLSPVATGENIGENSTMEIFEQQDIPHDPINETYTPEVESNKVLTLADGSLVTPDETVMINTAVNGDQPVDTAVDEGINDNAIPSILDVANEVQWDTLVAKTPNFEESIQEMEVYKVSPTKKYLETLSDSSSLDSFNDGFAFAEEDVEDDDIFDPMNFEWFEEIGEDGNEYRLSQMLADEEWDELVDDDVINGDKMTLEEFNTKAAELIEKTESELLETAEIMNSAPGSQSDYDATSTKKNPSLTPKSPITKSQAENKEPLYDQTRLDPISQLWGAPPDVLERFGNDEEDEQNIINDEKNFANIYSLWGEGAAGETSSQSEEDETKISSAGMNGVSQLWDPRLSPYDSNDEPEPSSSTNPFGGFGVEWWDEISDDGKEYRLSMMLADEEYEEEMEEEENSAPMTFEEFVDETEKLIEQAEDERKETEAIMNAPPNADFLDEDEEDKVQPVSLEASYEQVASSDQFGEMLIKMGADESSDENWSDDLLMKIAAESDNRDEDLNGDEDAGDESKIVSVSDIDVLEMDSVGTEEEADLTAQIDNEQ